MTDDVWRDMDITERLRHDDLFLHMSHEYQSELVGRAADEIDRLRAELDDALSVIRRINDATGNKSFESALMFHELLADVRRVAGAANEVSDV